MKIAIVTLTRGGAAVGRRLRKGLISEADVFIPGKIAARYPDTVSGCPAKIYGQGLAELIQEIYRQYEGLICIMSTGIVVRAVAPLLAHKTVDPPVVVVDEGARFAISLVAGHWGGGNRLAEQVAAALGAAPVITTASEVRGLTAVDVLAREWGAALEPLTWLPAVNAALVNGEQVPIFTDLDVPDRPADWRARGYEIRPLAEYRPDLEQELVLLTSRNLQPPSGLYVFLRPRNLVAGIGCRRGVDRTAILSAIEEALAMAGYSRCSLSRLATIGLKVDEAGLRQAADELGLPIDFYCQEELAGVWADYPDLRRSPLVKDKIGVDGVCEPASLLGRPGARLILPKTCWPGVTIALAEVKSGWWA